MSGSSDRPVHGKSATTHGPSLSVQDGSTWWHYSPAAGAISNEHDPSHGMDVGQMLEELLYPSALLASMDLRVLGERRPRSPRVYEVAFDEVSAP